MHRIGFVVTPGFQVMSLAVMSVFEFANTEIGEPVYDVRLLSETGGAVRASIGVSVATAPFEDMNLDTLIVGGRALIEPSPQGLIEFLRQAARRCRRVASTCRGAFILAEAGLLDGRRATTHWQRTRHFLKAYPKVKLEPDQIFVRDGNIWSSAGITAGIDLSLAMIAEDYGDDIAQKTARQLVLYHRRSGGQSQFSSLLELKAPTGRFGPLLAWAREHLDAPLSVEDMAEQAGMSSRHFTRAFIAETGTTPSKAVERLRIEVARQRVQSSSEAIERVAETTGFRDPERMRRAFIRAFGQPPQSLRRAARAG
jgi:transcriptional regulator GlxA family with amidase domain